MTLMMFELARLATTRPVSPRAAANPDTTDSGGWSQPDDHHADHDQGDPRDLASRPAPTSPECGRSHPATPARSAGTDPGGRSGNRAGAMMWAAEPVADPDPTAVTAPWLVDRRGAATTVT
jgi:hypothetical protein